MNDPFGAAINDFWEKGKAPGISVDSNYTEGEEIPPSYFFRTEKEMPEIEKKALRLCKGRVLDIGAAAGCHSLVLQKKGYNVTALEKSGLAASVLKKRGIQKVVCTDIYDFEGQQFDTILLLMNGTGIGETVAGMQNLLLHLKTLLAQNGQILIDSSDIKYLFREDDGSQWVDLANPDYYGEMTYKVRYKDAETTFKWLFVDFETLEKTAKKAGFQCSLAAKGDHFDYLAKLTL